MSKPNYQMQSYQTTYCRKPTYRMPNYRLFHKMSNLSGRSFLILIEPSSLYVDELLGSGLRPNPNYRPMYNEMGSFSTKQRCPNDATTPDKPATPPHSPLHALGDTLVSLVRDNSQYYKISSTKCIIRQYVARQYIRRFYNFRQHVVLCIPQGAKMQFRHYICSYSIVFIHAKEIHTF
jgi:hypothetical protein